VNAITGAFRRSYCLVGNEQDWSTCTTGFTFCMSSAVFADNTRMFIASYSSNEVGHRRAPGRSWGGQFGGVKSSARTSHLRGRHNICKSTQCHELRLLSCSVGVDRPTTLALEVWSSEGPCVLAVTV
jgi:hypothetical protein